MAKQKLRPTKAIRVKQGGKPREGWETVGKKGQNETASSGKTATGGDKAEG